MSNMSSSSVEDTTTQTNITTPSKSSTSQPLPTTPTMTASSINPPPGHIEIVVVYADQTRISHFVPLDFLLHNSGFFRKLSSHFDPNSSIIELKHITSIAFHLVIQWLPTQQFESITFSSSAHGDGGLYKNMEELVWLWILADHLRMPKLQNQVMGVLFDIGCALIGDWKYLKVAYDNTKPGSNLRLACATICCFNEPENEEYQRNPEYFCGQFMVDLEGLKIEEITEWKDEYIHEYLRVPEDVPDLDDLRVVPKDLPVSEYPHIIEEN